jgi:plasmid stabilization system protein ParE
MGEEEQNRARLKAGKRDHPLSGRIVPEFNVEHLREIIHPPFRIVYRFDRKRVRIVRIWRSERLLKLP